MSTVPAKLSALIRAKFRVKIKSLAEEARIIRREERFARNDCDRGSLTDHRRGIVRSEQRHTLLARAYLLGRPYTQVESANSKLVDAGRVARIIKSFVGNTAVVGLIENRDVPSLAEWIAQR